MAPLLKRREFSTQRRKNLKTQNKSYSTKEQRVFHEQILRANRNFLLHW
jgi:hypothetical protein